MKNSIDPRTNPSTKPTVSERKLAANRANAQHSTGPRTREGKARSAMNALRHGILARSAFNTRIDGAKRRAEFEAIVVGLAQEYQPRTMTEVMTVQQLAGCYWRLAKVWRYEQEAAWRMWASPGIPMDEFKEFDNMDMPAVAMREELITDAHEFLIKAGLEEPTIPNGASARTIIRYQGSIQTMITRCLSILERRRKERIKTAEPFEEVDYAAEATEKPETSGEQADAPQGARSDGDRGQVQKRTQKNGAAAAPSAAPEASSSEQPHPSKPSGPSKPPESA